MKKQNPTNLNWVFSFFNILFWVFLFYYTFYNKKYTIFYSLFLNIFKQSCSDSRPQKESFWGPSRFNQGQQFLENWPKILGKIIWDKAKCPNTMVALYWLQILNFRSQRGPTNCGNFWYYIQIQKPKMSAKGKGKGKGKGLKLDSDVLKKISNKHDGALDSSYFV